MRSIVLYYTEYAPPLLREKWTAIWHRDERIGFIRTEMHRGVDATRALDKAKPRKGETILNAIELP